MQGVVSRPYWLKRIRGRFWRHPVLLSVPVGIVAGLGALVFGFGLDQTSDLLLVQGAGYVMPQPGAEGGTAAAHASPRRWLLLLIPAVGGLLSGILVYSIAPEAEGHGTDSVIDAFHNRHGLIRRRVPIVKTIASILTIGSGGSAGREGPIGQIGAGFASALTSWLKTGERERRLLMLAGAGAGIGAIFRAPLGGALFISEVLYRDMELEPGALMLAFVASIVAYSLYCGVNGVWGPIFEVPDLRYSHPLELPFYVLLGAICAGVGTVYVRVFYGIRDRIFRPLRLPNHFKPALGGLGVGVIALFLPQVLGMGYGWTQLAIDGQLPIKLALALAAMKMVATGLTIGSGGSGGVFAPSMVIGGCLGATLGALLHRWMPGIVTQPAAFVLVGMAAFFAGVAKAPIASLVMVSEMTTGYGLLVPLMLATAVAYLLTPRSVSIYEKQVMTRADSPAHEGEFASDVLEGIHVRDALRPRKAPVVFRRDTPLGKILETMADVSQQTFPILLEDGSLCGVINAHDIRVFLIEQTMPPGLVVAQDLQTDGFPTVTMDEDLASALHKFHTTELEEVPVVENEFPTKAVAVLSRRELVAAYHDRMYRQKEPA